MNINYKMEIVKDENEGGYAVSFPELQGCVTCADTIEQAVKMADNAKKEWITACLEDGIEIPSPLEDKNYSGQFKLRIPKSLHRSLAEHSEKEGVSMNQYCVYLLSKNDTIFGNGNNDVLISK